MAAVSASAPARPTKSPAVSHAHPSPKTRTSAIRPAPVSVSASASAPAQRRASGSPVMSTTFAAPATDRPSIGASTTSASSRSPAMPPVLNAIPQALRADTAPQTLKPTVPIQTSFQSRRSTFASSASPVISKPTVPAASQMPGPTVPPQTSSPIPRGTSALAPPVDSKPTVPAVPQVTKATAPQTSASTACSVSPLASPINSKHTGSVVSQVPNTTAPSQISAPIIRRISASSTPSVSFASTMHAVPQMPKATVTSQTRAQTTRSSSAPSAPPGNFTPFVPTSTPPTTTSGVTSRPVAAPSTSTNRGISPLPSQARLAGRPRKRGRPRIYPDIVDPVDKTAGPQRAGERWKVHSQSDPPNARLGQYQPMLSGLPVLPNTAPAPASVPALPPSWKLHPGLVNRFQPASSLSAAGSRAPSQNLRPTAAHQPARVYTPLPNTAPNGVRSATQSAFGPVQPRYAPTQPRLASTQPPPAKMRKPDDSSRYAVTPSSKTLDLAHYVRQSPSRKHITYREDIVYPINASDVEIKVAYDPATIARDILIVADKHPTEKGLNHHLQVLRQNFQAVNYESDLATFRWDIVDPYVYYPPSVENTASRIGCDQTSTISTTRLDPTSRPPNLPNLTGPVWSGVPHVSTRDFSTALLARPAESHPVCNTITTTTGTTSTSTISSVTAGAGSASLGLRGTAVTSTGITSFATISPLTIGADTTQTGATNNYFRSSYLAHPPATAILSTSTPVPTPKSTHEPIPTPPSAANLNSFGALPFKPSSYYSPLRPTGPPFPYSLHSLPPPSGSQEVLPSVSAESPTLIQAPATVSLSSARSPVKSKTIPSASPSSKPAATRLSSKTFQVASQSLRRKHSRKSSLPKGLPESQVVIPSPSQSMAPIKKKPGRPPKADVQVEVAVDNRPAPQYQVFPCKWTKCEAQLHNLQAIQTHVLGVHIPHHIVCAWDGCTDKTPRAAANMWEHVKVDHMSPLAWQLGDGPAASVTVADGIEVPETSSQGRHDTMTLPADRDSVKIFSRTHGTQTNKQKAQVMEEGGRRWKEDAGPDVDTSDRRLSTPPRLPTSSHTETAYTLSEVRVVI